MVNTRYSNLRNFLSPGIFVKPCGCVFCRGKLPLPRGVKASWASAGLQKLMSDAEIFTNYMAVRGAGGWGGGGERRPCYRGWLGLLVFWEYIEVCFFLESLRSCLLWGVVIFLAWSVRCVWLLKSWGFNVGSGFIGWTECFSYWSYWSTDQMYKDLNLPKLFADM